MSTGHQFNHFRPLIHIHRSQAGCESAGTALPRTTPQNATQIADCRSEKIGIIHLDALQALAASLEAQEQIHA